MKIVLADPPRKEAYYDNSYPNLGILYLISYLRKNARTPLEAIYLEGDFSLVGHLEFIASENPDIYGLSFASWTSNLAFKTINAVKKAFPNLMVICGGPEPTANWKEIFRKSKVDICVLGEGEVTMTDLTSALAKGSDLTKVDGLALRQSNENISLTNKRALIGELDDIPFPSWDLVDFENYTGMHINKANPQTHMLVSRGCPFDCNFCSNPVWKLSKPWARMRTPENIAAEVQLLYDRGVREIYMTSDEFNISEKWALDVCEAIKKLDLKKLYFQCNLRADKVSGKLARAFSEINLWLVHLGIESGNQRTLNGVGKHITIEQILRTCRLMRREGVKIFGFVMLFHAWEEDGKLKWENSEDVSNTLSFCHRLLASGLIQYMSWQVATPMAGSRLYRTAQKYGLIANKNIAGVWAQNMLLPGIGQCEFKRALRKGMLIKNYYLVRNGNINLSHLDRVWRNFKVLLGLPVG